MGDAALGTRTCADSLGRLTQPSPDSAAEAAFKAYVDTARQAQQSLNLTDGIEAGRCWGRFVALFEGRVR